MHDFNSSCTCGIFLHMMKRGQKIIRIEQIADMKIHNLCIHRRAPAVILKVFRRGKTMCLQPLYTLLSRHRIGVHIAQRRQLAAHFGKQLLAAAQIGGLLPSGGNTHGMLPQRYRLLLRSSDASEVIFSVSGVRSG